MDVLLTLGTPVLLYHATYREVPPDLASQVHNVAPERLLAHLDYLRRRLRFVSVDELVAARSPRGLAALTFDDGYRCVLETMADDLLALDIPFTIFLNGASLEGKVFWRDKVRAIVGRGLVEECEAFFTRTEKIPGLSFYAYTKDPRNDSRTVDEEIDRFLESRKIPVCPSRYTIDGSSGLRDHPLITYGNHSHHHYVLSSMPPEAQAEEIARTQRALEAIPGIGLSRIFSIPFGEPRDFDEHTLDLLRDLGYRGALLSRQRLNFRRRRHRGVRLLERFMPEPTPLARQLKQFRRLALA